MARMSDELARVAVGALYAYLAIGAVAAVPFVVRGVRRVDPRGRGASLGFRLVILPACVGLWPLVLARWVRGGPPDERSAHRRAARRPEP